MKSTSDLMPNVFSRSNLVLLVMAVVTLVVTAPEMSRAASAKPAEIIEVAADLPDSSVELVGYLILPPDLYREVDPPLVVLLHEMGESHRSWRRLWESLYTQGMAVFAIDLRGHGLSIFDLRTQRNRAANTFYEGEFLKYPDDVKFLVDTCIFLHGDRFDESKIAVVGADVGANAGLLYALQEPRVTYVAMISPGLDLKGLRTAPAMAQIEDVDIFLATAEQDIYSYITVDLLTDLYADKVEYEIYSSIHHGTRLMNTSAELYHRLLRDIIEHLRPDIQLRER